MMIAGPRRTPAMYGKPDKRQLDEMVMQTATYFREREAALVG
jgi:hypothetical protein